MGWNPVKDAQNFAGDVSDTISNTLGPVVSDLGGAIHHNFQAWGQLGQGNLGGAGKEFTQFGQSMQHAFGLYPKAGPQPGAPPPPPVIGDASTTTMNAGLQEEGRMASASTVLTGGAGLLDEPKTASRTLLGS